MCPSAFVCPRRGSRSKASYEYQDYPFGERWGTDANLCPGLPLGESFVCGLVTQAAAATWCQVTKFICSYWRVHVVAVHLFSVTARYWASCCFKMWQMLSLHCLMCCDLWSVHSKFCSNKDNVQIWAQVVLSLNPRKIEPPSKPFEVIRELPRLSFFFLCCSCFMKT